MNLKQLNDSEVLGLICSQVNEAHATMFRMFDGTKHTSEVSTDDVLNHLRTNLNRILDLIEEIGPRQKGTTQ